MLNSVALRGFSETVPWAWKQCCQIHLLVFALLQVCWCSFLFCGCMFFHGFGKTELEFVYGANDFLLVEEEVKLSVKCFFRKSNLKGFSSYLFLVVKM